MNAEYEYRDLKWDDKRNTYIRLVNKPVTKEACPV